MWSRSVQKPQQQPTTSTTHEISLQSSRGSTTCLRSSPTRFRRTQSRFCASRRIRPDELLRWNDLNLKQTWPQLPCHKQPVPHWIIRNSIQHSVVAANLNLRKNPRQIDPSQNLPRLRRNARNLVRHPHIGVNFPADILQLIQLLHRRSLVRHTNAPHLRQRIRIQEMKRLAPVTQNQVLAVLRQSPSFPWIMKRPQQPETRPIVHERHMRFPRELDERIPPIRQPLSKILRRNADLFEYSPCLQILFAQRRLPIEPGALVQMPIQVNHPLRE